MLSKREAFTKSAASFGGSNRKGRLFVISSSSGTGKTTLANELLKKDPAGLVRSISYTTRALRANETHGQDYHFVTKKEFLAIEKRNGFLEWANVFGHLYGTPRKEVEEWQAGGKNVLLVIDVQGAKKVKQTTPEAVFIFLAPPSIEELKRRLEKRGTDSKREIAKRLKIATKELKELNDPSLCDYRIVNRNIETAREILEAIIHAERKNT